MFIDKHSIKIKKYGANSYTDISNMLVEAKYQYNKLWSSDSGRNLAGKQSGTLIGIFPKIILTFKRLTKTELESIVKILDAPKQVIRYYDPNKQSYQEPTTYTGDWESVSKSIMTNSNGHKTEQFTISFISVSKR